LYWLAICAALSDTLPEIRIIVGGWVAAAVDAQLLAIVLSEQMGYPVQLTMGDKNYSNYFGAMEVGEQHLYPEVWRSGVDGASYDHFVVKAGTVIDAGPLGMQGRNGIFTQDALVSTRHGLAGWRGLMEPETNELFGRRLIAFTEDWAPLTGILEQLKIPITVDFVGADVAEDVIYDKLNTDEPVLFWLWEPHPLHSMFDLQRIQLPTYSPRKYEANLSDYPTDILTKTCWAGFEQYAPQAFDMYGSGRSPFLIAAHALWALCSRQSRSIRYRRFSLSKEGLEDMVRSVMFGGKSVFQASCEWLKRDENRRIWTDWLPGAMTCKPGYFMEGGMEKPECKLCEPGFFSKGGRITKCQACGQGWYQDKPGQFECQSCDFFHAAHESAEDKRFYYQDLVGQAGCSLCAKNTQRGPSLALKSSCLCMHGYYTPSGLAGSECQECPPGHFCAGDLASPKLSDLNLGVLLPVTGDWPEARTFIGAIRVVQEDIMADPSILQQKLVIKYIWKDDACSSQKSSASLGEILDDLKRRNLELSGLIGPACSAGCENTAFTTGEKKIVQISYSCASATLTDNLKYPTFVRTTSSYVSWMPAIVHFAKWASWQQLAILSSTQNLFALAAPELASKMLSEGMKVFPDLRFEVGKYTARAKLQTIANARTQVLLVMCYGDDILRFALAGWDMGMLGKGYAWLGLTDVVGAESAKSAGELQDVSAEHARKIMSYWVYFEPHTNATATFFERVRNATRDYFPTEYDATKPTSTYAANLYDSIMLFAITAGRHIGEGFDGVNMTKWMQNISFNGMTGRVELDENGDLKETIQARNYLRVNDSMASVQIGVYYPVVQKYAPNVVPVRWPGDTTDLPLALVIITPDDKDHTTQIALGASAAGSSVLIIGTLWYVKKRSTVLRAILAMVLTEIVRLIIALTFEFGDLATDLFTVYKVVTAEALVSDPKRAERYRIAYMFFGVLSAVSSIVSIGYRARHAIAVREQLKSVVVHPTGPVDVAEDMVGDLLLKNLKWELSKIKREYTFQGVSILALVCEDLPMVLMTSLLVLLDDYNDKLVIMSLLFSFLMLGVKSASIPALIRIMNRQKEIILIIAQLDESGEHNAELEHEPLAELSKDAVARAMAFQPNNARRRSSFPGSSTAAHDTAYDVDDPAVPPHNLNLNLMPLS